MSLKYISIGLILCLNACHSPKEHPKTNRFTNSQGKELALDKAPQRIISCSPAITEIIYALHQEHRLVARTNYCIYPEATKEVESIGEMRNPCLECILHLKPDIVIASTHFKKTTAQGIEDLGMPFAWILSQESINGAGDLIVNIGKLINEEEKAEQLWETMQEDMAKTMAAIPINSTKPTVYYVIGFGKQGDYTAGGDTFIHELITKAGGINIAANIKGWNYNLEALIQADPDIILIPDSRKEAFCNYDHYKELRAIKNKQVYGVNHHMVQLNGSRIHIALKTFAHIFYPETNQ